MAPMAASPGRSGGASSRRDRRASWNGREDTLQCLASLAGVALRLVRGDRGRQRLERRQRRGRRGGLPRGGRDPDSATTPASPAASTPGSRPRSSAAPTPCSCSTTTWSSSRGSSRRSWRLHCEPERRRRVQPDPLRRDARSRLVRRRDVQPDARPSRAQHRLRRSAAARDTTAVPRRLRLRRRDADPARRRSREIGLLDEGLFAYREDLDWSLRAAAQGGGRRRSGEHRPAPGLGLHRRRGLADLALLRHPQRARRCRSATRRSGGSGRRCGAPSRSRPPGPGVALGTSHRCAASGRGRLERRENRTTRPSKGGRLSRE